MSSSCEHPKWDCRKTEYRGSTAKEERVRVERDKTGREGSTVVIRGHTAVAYEKFATDPKIRAQLTEGPLACL